MRVYLPRFYVRDLDTNLASMNACCDDAAALDCGMLLFPEQFLTGYYGDTDLPRIKEQLSQASARHPQLMCVFGTITEDGANQQCVYLAGAQLARYTKVHLFEPNGEHKLWQPGERYVAVKHGAWRIGLATCNDVRFPEQARALKLKYNINLLTYPALWPWARDHTYAALLRSRAIENGAFCLGCSVAGVDNGVERFDGAGNHVFDPLGTELRPDGRVYTLDPAVFQLITVDTRTQYREITQVDLVDLDPAASLQVEQLQQS